MSEVVEIKPGQVWVRNYPDHWKDVDSLFISMTIFKKSEYRKQWYVIRSDGDLSLEYEDFIRFLFHLDQKKED